jgi:L-asparaginase
MKKKALKKVLLIHTGGTLGMHNLEPITVKGKAAALATDLYRKVPELKALADIEVLVLMNKDSSSMCVSDWRDIGDVIHRNFSHYAGFVVVHGTDTMVFTAAALSFMFPDLSKPIVLTGSQRPLAEIRSDARRNLISAVEIAAAGQVKEVAIFFDRLLLRGNRAKKSSIDEFAAFESPNYPPLADVGLEVNVNGPALLSAKRRKHRQAYCHDFDPRVLFIKFFPSMSLAPFIAALRTAAFRGVIIEAYGAGNLPAEEQSYKEFLTWARELRIPVVILSQAYHGSVRLDLYEAGAISMQMGAISGKDITSEAAIVKMMKLLAEQVEYKRFARRFTEPLAGEMS